MAAHYFGTPVYSFLKDEGGSRDQNIDASTTPVEYAFVAPFEMNITSMVTQIQDSGIFKATGYGKGDPLPNGLLVEHRRVENGHGSRVHENLDLLGGFPIQRNNDWIYYCERVGYFDIGQNDNIGTARWYFADNSGVPLHMHPGDSLVLTVQDDLTFLTQHRSAIQGAAIVRGYNRASGPAPDVS